MRRSSVSWLETLSLRGRSGSKPDRRSALIGERPGTVCELKLSRRRSHGRKAGLRACPAGLEHPARALPARPERAATDDLKQAIVRANRRIREAAAGNRELNGMGTTLVALLEDGDSVHLANVGDSRAYLLREGELTQVTVDHTLVQELIDEGKLTPEDAERHPQRSMITRALGVDREVEIDLFTYKLQLGDRLLLCTDGLSGVLEPTQIRNVLLRVRDPQKAADRLVAMANEGGGPDNITVIVVDTAEEAGEPDSTDDLAPGIGSATGAMPVVEDDGDGAGRRSDGRAARAAKDRSLAMHRRLQRFLVAGIVLLVVAALLVAGRSFLFSRYWVGFDGDQVAVFQGVPGDVAGLHFSRLVERSPVSRAQVPAGYAARLEDGVPADDLQDALASLELPYDLVVVRGADEKTLKVTASKQERTPGDA